MPIISKSDFRILHAALRCASDDDSSLWDMLSPADHARADVLADILRLEMAHSAPRAEDLERDDDTETYDDLEPDWIWK